MTSKDVRSFSNESRSKSISGGGLGGSGSCITSSGRSIGDVVARKNRRRMRWRRQHVREGVAKMKGCG